MKSKVLFVSASCLVLIGVVALVFRIIAPSTPVANQPPVVSGKELRGKFVQTNGIGPDLVEVPKLQAAGLWTLSNARGLKIDLQLDGRVEVGADGRSVIFTDGGGKVVWSNDVLRGFSASFEMEGAVIHKLQSTTNGIFLEVRRTWFLLDKKTGIVSDFGSN